MIYFLFSLTVAVLIAQTLALRLMYRMTKMLYKSSPKVESNKLPPLSHFPFNATSSGSKSFLEKVTKVKLEHPSAYNGTYVKDHNQTRWMFYRVDSFKKHAKHSTSLYCQKLDNSFNPISQAFNVSDQLSKGVEDPRIFLKDGMLKCIYNESYSGSNLRSVSIGEFDSEKMVITPTHRLLMNLQTVEKNWTPFVDSFSNHKFRFAYSLSPLIVMEADLENGKISYDFQGPENPPSFFPNSWVSKYGQPRGGTQAIACGDHYLTFFHSSFRSKADFLLCYVMGACLISKEKPYKVLAVSKTPIVFDTIYDTEITNPFGMRKSVIFPMSVEREGDVLHVSCGENDSSVKIITMNEAKLLASLKSV
jgi:predicted GH43/DUF377 family glycosyl hydrolase